MPESRRRRPPVERTEPIRSVNARKRSAAKTNGASTNPGDKEAPSKGDAREAGYRTINDAYRLIDEYVRQGQRMAENLWLPLTGLETDEKSQFKAPERFMRAMSDMTLSWVELMQQWTANVQPNRSQAPTGESSPFTAGQSTRDRGESPAGAGGAPGSRSLRVAVESRGRVEVSVHVADATALTSLVPTELRPFGAEAPPITGVSLDLASSPEAPVLRIRVPDDQPPGAYNGLLVERGSERPRGTVSLLVL